MGDVKVSSIPDDADRSPEEFKEVAVPNSEDLLVRNEFGSVVKDASMVVQRTLTLISKAPISDAASPTMGGLTTGVHIV